MMKKILSLILCLAVLAGNLVISGFSVYADETEATVTDETGIITMDETGEDTTGDETTGDDTTGDDTTGDDTTGDDTTGDDTTGDDTTGDDTTGDDITGDDTTGDGTTGDDTTTDEGEAVACIGDVKYTTLEKAVNDALNGDVITVLTDISPSGTIEINKTLTLRSDSGAAISGNVVVTGALTLTDISLKSTSYDKPVVTVEGGSMTMKSGAALGGDISVVNGTFNFYGGTVDAESVITTGSETAFFRMSGNAGFNGSGYLELYEGSYIEITDKLTGKGGLTIYMPNVKQGDRVALISAGVSLSDAQLARFSVVDEYTEYKVTVSGDEMLVDKSADSTEVARIGKTGYDSLEEAFKAASDMSKATVTLTASVTLEKSVTVSGNVTLASDGSYSISASDKLKGSAFVISKGSSLKIGDSDNTITLSGASNGAALLDVKGNLSIDSSVVITDNNNTSEKYNKGAVYVNGGSFAMTGGAITANNSNKGTVYIESGSFTMTGGAINNNTATGAGGVYIASGSFNLAGGSVYANSGDGVWNGGSFTLSGKGTVYSSATYPSTVFLNGEAVIKVASDWVPSAAKEGYSNVIPVAMTEPELYDVVAQFDGTAAADNFKMSDRYEEKFALIVRDKNLIVAAADSVYTVYWENNAYMTLEEAVASLPENTQATLKIVADVVVSAPVTIKKGMTVTVTTDENPATLEEYTARTVTREEGFKDAIFSVEKDGTLILEAAADKSLVFDGESKAVTSAMIVTSGGTVVGKGVTLKANNNKSAEKLGASAVYTFGGGVYVANGGSCTVSGGSISGNYASYGAGVYVNDGMLAMSEGEIRENTALYGAGVYLETTQSSASVFASFAMSGGSLTGNKAVNESKAAGSGVAGGVYIANGSSFMMSGGTLSKNTAASAAGICVGTAVYAQNIPQPKLILSDKANIASDNNVYLAMPGISYISVTSKLSAASSITITLPSPMPQNMKLVAFELGENQSTNETAAQNSLKANQFVLDKEASEYYQISTSYSDKSVLVNVAGDYLPSRAKAGKHHNGLALYEEGDEKAEDESKTPVVYSPVNIRDNGSFTAYYQMSYYPNLYKNINTFITAPFPEGTRIVMIDTSNEKNIGYYYYEVSGDETVVSEAEPVDGTKSPDVIEIPLISFYKMGTRDVYYEPEVNEDTSKKAVTTEKLLFVVDFTDVRADEGVSLEGEFEMCWNHYYPGSSEGERYDISGNVMSTVYTVSNITSSTVTVAAGEENTLNVSYTLSQGSAALAYNKGVILFQLGRDSFPGGTVLTDGDGNQYVSVDGSDSIAVPLPCDQRGNVLAEGNVKLTVSNYYGSALVGTTLRCVIAPSNDGHHRVVGAAYDAESEGVLLDMEAQDTYSILVSTLDGTKKPYYESYEVLRQSANLEMMVTGLANTVEVDSFNLSLLKKTDDEYLPCSLSELFEVSSDYGSEVILNTGHLALELAPGINELMGNEYKIAFRVGDAVEYVKVNVIEEKKK